ncbi:hypothetical protein SUGI_0343190 [Cryptomeria japonica]|nr:hypothetical protein SUGI_0343190 [Cryptomeria japonica]
MAHSGAVKKNWHCEYDSLEALDLDYLNIEFSNMLTVDAWCKDLEFVVKHSSEAEFRSFGEGSVNIEVHEMYSS